MAGAARDNLHSRVVALLKVVMPLAALAILSSLFLFSRTIDPQDAIPYADVDVEDRLRQPRLTDAGYSGMTEDGAALTLTAAEARPDETGGTATGLSGVLSTADGATTRIIAPQAVIDSKARRIELSGGVQLVSSSGYQIDSTGFGLALDRTWMESRGPVTALGPMGDIRADSLRLDRNADGAGYLLVFNGAVRLVYQPAK
jgi:lipopolysaccharide export system protein LptC